MTTAFPEALRDPSAYPGAGGPVELRETHISWVALVGDRAYKVKKPLVLPFVDYGTAARRRALCEEEVRVNRRLAPDLYLGVVALAPRPGGGLTVAPAGTPGAVEHAVEMRRYDEAATLAAVLADGRATAAQLDAIGGLLARFHRTAGPGVAAPLEEVVAETLTSLRALDAPDRAEAVESALRATAAERAARPACDGHGDLRAEHVLLTDPLAVVDALEFDAALRAADPGYDLAFLIMDLLRAEPAGTLACALLDGYRAAGGDPGSAQLMACFVTVRALVRAKVDLLRAGQLDGSAAASRRARGLALVELADRVLWDVRLPPVVCVAGLSASGKSTVADALADAAGRERLSSDRLRGRDDDRYASERRTAVYGALGVAAAAAPRPVVVDATFLRPQDTAAFVAACPRETGWIVCTAPPTVLLERARRRDAAGPEHGSEAGVAVVRAQLAEAPDGPALPAPPLATLDTTRELAALLGELARIQPA